MAGNGFNKEPLHSFDRTKRPLVSVIIPIFNGSQYVRNVFSTLNNQIFMDFEVVIVDDGSNDDTFQQIQSEIMTFKNLNIRAIRSSHQGLAATRNIGIRNSVGNYLAFLDCDDSWQENKLKSQVEYMVQSECVAVFSKVTLVSADGSRSLSDSNKQSISESPLDLIKREFIVYGGSSNILCKREIFEKAGIFDETLEFVEDFDMWLRISKLGQIVQLPERSVDILIHPDSMQRIGSIKTKHGLLKSKVLILSKYISEYPIEVKNEIAYTMAEELYEAVKEIDFRYIYLILVLVFQPSMHSPATLNPLRGRVRLLLLTLCEFYKLVAKRVLGRLKRMFLSLAE